MAEQPPNHDQHAEPSQDPTPDGTDSIDEPGGATAPVSEVSGPTGRSFAGLVDRDRIVLLVAGCLMLLLMFARWAQLSGWGRRSVEVLQHDEIAFAYRIDMNDATWVQWMQLDGIGETLSRRIVDDRDLNGPFESVDELTRVAGIGPKTLERLRPWLMVRKLDNGQIE